MIFGEKLADLTTRPKSIYWNTPNIVRATILDLAKHHMYSFHYNVMRPNFECRLLYSDTDSLLYVIKSDDFCTELSQKPQSVLVILITQITRPIIFYTIQLTKESFSNTRKNSPATILLTLSV